MAKRDAGRGLEHRSVILAGGRRYDGRQPGGRTKDADRLFLATARTGAGLAFGAFVAWTVISGLLARKWPWQLYGAQASQSDVLKLALGVVAAGGAAIALVVNYRRQQHLERDDSGKRDQTRLFTERFGAAAAQLGGDRPAVRLAGVYAMAALADEWTSSRQQCVDVLCGYLRLPYTGEPPPGHPQVVVEQRQYAGGAIQRAETTTYQAGEIQVRKAIVETIRQHLQHDTDSSWSDLSFDFSGAILTDASFAGATFSGDHTTFDGATFAGARTTFNQATFCSARTTFDEATFSSNSTQFVETTFAGDAWFMGVDFSGNTDFVGGTFCARATFDRSRFSGDRTWFDEVTCSGLTSFSGVAFLSRDVSFHKATFAGAFTSFEAATFSGAEATFREATFSGAHVRFDKAMFTGKRTSLDKMTFSSNRTSFDNATFSGEFVSFQGTELADPDSALRDARILAEDVRWGPVPPRSAWPRAASAQGQASPT